MTWPGRSDFISAPNTTWTGPSGDMAGTAISAKGFTFLRVKDAGELLVLSCAPIRNLSAHTTVENTLA